MKNFARNVKRMSEGCNKLIRIVISADGSGENGK